MLEEIRDLGFEYAELSHGIRLSLVPGIIDAHKAGVIKISTLHNFCPLPIGCKHANPNVFKFSSTNVRERENAYKHTMKTIEMADQLGAKLIVLHMGEIDMRNYTDKLIDLLEAGKQDTPKYQKLCQKAELKREKAKVKYCDLAYKMLEQITEQASMRGIKLGIEIREDLAGTISAMHRSRRTLASSTTGCISSRWLRDWEVFICTMSSFRLVTTVRRGVV